MRRRDFVMAAPALILAGCKNMDAGGGLSAMSDLAKAATLSDAEAVSYTHLRAHETVLDLVCRLLLENKNN